MSDRRCPSRSRYASIDAARCRPARRSRSLALALPRGLRRNAESAAAGRRRPPAVQLAPENVVDGGDRRDLVRARSISGQLTPAREATVRAQVGGSIVVAPGRSRPAGRRRRGGRADRLARSRGRRSTSAQAAVKSAETALAVATTEAQRTETLVKGGALAARDLEQAKQRRLERRGAARGRAGAAALGRGSSSTTRTVKAPFGGIVSDAPGQPRRRRGAGHASSSRSSTRRACGSRRSCRRIRFSRCGRAPRCASRFAACRRDVRRARSIASARRPIRSRVRSSIFVSLPNTGGKLIAGLFAEGRVETATRKGIVVPLVGGRRDRRRRPSSRASATARPSASPSTLGAAADRHRAGRGRERRRGRRRAGRRLGEGHRRPARRSGRQVDASSSS